MISSRTGYRGDQDNFTLSAPMQPGNSGGPVLGRDGRVIGVAVARIDDIMIAEATGSLPQNINYAINAATLWDFLSAANVLVDQSEIGVDLSDAPLPARLENAVVAITCR